MILRRIVRGIKREGVRALELETAQDLLPRRRETGDARRCAVDAHRCSCQPWG
jgi:hypothetical protein